ncbi:DUF448 domain-containing protein [Novosphingobium sp. FSY-8]|uniref:DUF448 domain-containing protein n=1 Tax=Novosphingobium ovatum TaxID=1908523 RepID=A0ABW9XAE1_9SPHN|nr:DUF448 domain-containing protein [Novosphingobium ovatum]NBC35498.1 DUF448 domain-containing protein [Novosphingobium ovatum]
MRTPRNERVGSGPGAAKAAGSKHTQAPRGPKGADSVEDGPERKCILSGRHDARDSLIRLAISPDGPDGVAMVLPDVLARAPGRGAWIGVTRAELEVAIAKGKLKGALARAYKGAKLSIPDDLPDLIEAALTRAFYDRLGLAYGAGQVLVGSDRIAENARMGRVVWLAHASDAGSDGNRKLDQAWRVGQEAEGSGMTGVTLPLDRAGLSVALGRENVVHLALTDRAVADRLAPLLGRLLHYLDRPDADGQDIQGKPVADAAVGADDDVLM